MYISLEEAKNHLRLDLDDTNNDTIIEQLINSVPDYINRGTGLTMDQQMNSSLCITAGLFLIQLWYNAEGTDVNKLYRTIDSLLNTLKNTSSKP